jgi:hypothetical protein
MKRQRLLTLSLLMVILVGLAVLVQPVAPAGAGDGGGGIQGGGGSSLSIPGNSFVPDSSSTVFRTDATGGVVLLADTSRYMHAPVNLPDGATLNSVEFFYYDNLAPGYMTATLVRDAPGISSSIALAVALSPAGAVGYGSDLRSLSTPEVVNNSRYNYSIEVYWSADSTGAAGAKLMGIKVLYGEP